jgi:hypothetical protein
MSALGQKQTCAAQNGMSALPPKADMPGATRDVRFVPIADMRTTRTGGLGSSCRWPVRNRHRNATLVSPYTFSASKGSIVARGKRGIPVGMRPAHPNERDLPWRLSVRFLFQNGR